MEAFQALSCQRCVILERKKGKNFSAAAWSLPPGFGGIHLFHQAGWGFDR